MKTQKTISELREIAIKALDSLPEQARMTLWLRYCMGMDIQETARILSLNEFSLGRILNSALNNLKAHLHNQLGPITLPALRAALKSFTPQQAPSSLLDDIDRTINPASNWRLIDTAASVDFPPYRNREYRFCDFLLWIPSDFRAHLKQERQSTTEC